MSNPIRVVSAGNRPVGSTPLRGRAEARAVRISLTILLLCIPHSARPQSQTPIGPPSAPMTIPLPDPLFWDPVSSSGDYTIVEQSTGLYLLRPTTGRVIARMRSPRANPAVALEAEAIHVGPPDPEGLSPLPGWPFRPGGPVPATPVVEDIDGDGTREAIFVTSEGWIWVLGPDALPPPGWPIHIESGLAAAPALADLDGDRLLEIIVGDAMGRVHAITPAGAYAKGWPASIPGNCELPAIQGAVSAADIDGDGSIEIVACQAAGRVCVFSAAGRVRAGWPTATAPAADPPNAGTVFARPALGDLDGDGRSEIVVTANNYRVHAWNADGRPVRGWPRLLDNRARLGYADPVLADLDADGSTDLIIATDQGFSGPPRIYALDALGKSLRGWPVNLPERANSGVAVGDLGGDGGLDLVAATMGEESWIVAYDHRGRMRRGFPVGLAQLSVNAGPILADVDGDGSVEIVVAALRTHFDPAVAVLAFDDSGDLVAPFPIRLEGCEVICGGPCVADLDSDGRLDLLLGTEVQGGLYAWPLPTADGPAAAPWPKGGFDSGNTGMYTHPADRGESASRTTPTPTHPLAEQPPPEAPLSSLQSVSFTLAREGPVRLCILSVQGRLIRTLVDSVLPIGSYTLSWDGNDDLRRPVPAGLYVYELRTPDREARGQLLLLK